MAKLGGRDGRRHVREAGNSGEQMTAISSDGGGMRGETGRARHCDQAVIGAVEKRRLCGGCGRGGNPEGRPARGAVCREGRAMSGKDLGPSSARGLPGKMARTCPFGGRARPSSDGHVRDFRRGDAPLWETQHAGGGARSSASGMRRGRYGGRIVAAGEPELRS